MDKVRRLLIFETVFIVAMIVALTFQNILGDYTIEFTICTLIGFIAGNLSVLMDIIKDDSKKQ